MVMTTESYRLLLRISEAAAALGIGRSTLYELLARGEIETVKINRSVRIPISSLERWVSERSDPPP